MSLTASKPKLVATQQWAIDLCRSVEYVCPKFGAHVALTGGTLYKDGPRKDCDILFYRIRQWKLINKDGLFKALEEQCGFTWISGMGWCHKAVVLGIPVDCFFPEEDGSVNDYETAS